MTAQLRRLFPREHGVWFMWLVPVVLGGAIGGWSLLHLPVALAAVSLHLASHAALEAAREGGRGRWWWRWAGAFGTLGTGLMAYPVWRFPAIAALGAAAAALFAANLRFASRRQERTLLNDALAIAGLETWAPVSYLVGAGTLDRAAMLLWAFCFLFFFATAFHVKTLFRERSDPAFKRVSDAVHLALLGVPALAGLPELALAYLPSALRTWLMPRGRRIPPLAAGLVEIANSLVFAGLLASLWKR